MSADNGIYILRTKDQCRVIHAQAIENLYYSYIKSYNDELVPTRVVEYFGYKKYTRDYDKALKIASYMADDCPILEHGIKTIRTHKTWKQIIEEAKQLAVKELEYLKNEKEDSWNKYYITKLERVLNNF